MKGNEMDEYLTPDEFDELEDELEGELLIQTMQIKYRRLYEEIIGSEDDEVPV